MKVLVKRLFGLIQYLQTGIDFIYWNKFLIVLGIFNIIMEITISYIPAAAVCCCRS